jgi:endogenous inhibitor of DNA gyrase (YacG/DUF329 family)
MKKQYKKFKNALDVAKTFSKNKKQHLKFICSCGQEVTVNGATSHSLVCKFAYDSKIDFLVKNFKLNKICPVCSKKIKYTSIVNFRGHVNFCCSNCRRKAINLYLNLKKITKNVKFAKNMQSLMEKLVQKNAIQNLSVTI